MKNLAGKLGKLVFPDIEEKKSRRITIQIMAGLLLVLISIAGMKIYCYQETRQHQRFQQIKGTEIILPEIAEEKSGEGRKENPQETDETGGLGDMVETDKDNGKAEDTVTLIYDWDTLAETNADIKGWLCLPDTPIDLPVVGAPDNDYYLNHDFWKQEKSAGCPFMDKDTDQWDFNKTIYAHNMSRPSEAMFSPLLHYKDEAYFQSHRKLFYTECYGDTAEYQVMAVVKYNAGAIESWDFRTRNHADMESYNIWMEQLQEHALFYAEPDHAPEQILTLSTCDRSEYGKDGRLVIVAGKKDCS
jgi:sortase B